FTARICSFFRVFKHSEGESASRNGGNRTGCARCSRTPYTREAEYLARWHPGRTGQSRRSRKQSRKGGGRARSNTEREGRSAGQIRRDPEGNRFVEDARERRGKKCECFDR